MIPALVVLKERKKAQVRCRWSHHISAMTLWVGRHAGDPNPSLFPEKQWRGGWISNVRGAGLGPSVSQTRVQLAAQVFKKKKISETPWQPRLVLSTRESQKATECKVTLALSRQAFHVGWTDLKFAPRWFLDTAHEDCRVGCPTFRFK